MLVVSQLDSTLDIGNGYVIVVSSNGSGPKPGRARPEACVFWNARSPTFGEGPKPVQAWSPTFWEGTENLSFFTIVHSKIPRPVKARSPAFMEGPKARPCPTLQIPGSALARLFRARPITSCKKVCTYNFIWKFSSFVYLQRVTNWFMHAAEILVHSIVGIVSKREL